MMPFNKLFTLGMFIIQRIEVEGVCSMPCSLNYCRGPRINPIVQNCPRGDEDGSTAVSGMYYVVG